MDKLSMFVMHMGRSWVSKGPIQNHRASKSKFGFRSDKILPGLCFYAMVGFGAMPTSLDKPTITLGHCYHCYHTSILCDSRHHCHHHHPLPLHRDLSARPPRQPSSDNNSSCTATGTTLKRFCHTTVRARTMKL